MVQCNPSGIYSNLFLTVPQRCGTTKETLIRWIRAWRSDMTFFEVVLEPYAKPKAGNTHHFHVGLCFTKIVRGKREPHRVRILKFVTACHKSELFTGMNFCIPLVRKGASADQIFTKYFANPSKYKALDEHPTLVPCCDPVANWKALCAQFASWGLPPPKGNGCGIR